jgi:hypothetical protein
MGGKTGKKIQKTLEPSEPKIMDLRLAVAEKKASKKKSVTFSKNCLEILIKTLSGDVRAKN